MAELRRISRKPVPTASTVYVAVDDTPDLDEDDEYPRQDHGMPDQNHVAASHRPPAHRAKASDRPLRKSKKRGTFWRSWSVELFSYGLAAAAFMAMIVILKIRDGRPLPNWPSSITVNSLVSVFTAIMKTAMIMPVAESISEQKWLWFSSRSRPLIHMQYLDAASRGPLGSIKLLRRLPRAFLPCLGAIVTLCALAIDPFTQQIIQFHTCSVPAGAAASISRANVYNIPSSGAGIDYFPIDPAMLATLYQGVLNPPDNATAAVSTVCNANECNFLVDSNDGIAYHSLAMCYDVGDISDEVTSPPGNDGTSGSWSFSLSSGLLIEGPGGGAAMSSVQIDDPVTDSTTAALFAFEALMSYSDSGTQPKFRGIAFRVRLYPCLNAYGNGSIIESQLSERVISTRPLRRFDVASSNFYYSLAGDYPAVQGIDCLPADRLQGSKTQETGVLPDGTRYLPYYSNSSTTDDPLWYDPLCTYALGLGPSYAIPPILQGFFGSPSTQNSTAGVPIGGPATLSWVHEGGVLVNGPLWLQSMWAEGGGNMSTVVKVVEGLANQITAAMRRRGDDKDTQQGGRDVLGSAFVNETCIHVAWAWFSLNAILMSLTFLLFTVTLFQSNKHHSRYVSAWDHNADRGAWKSSTLPLLWCGLSDRVKKEFQSEAATKAVMERQSRGLSVRLSGGDAHNNYNRGLELDH